MQVRAEVVWAKGTDEWLEMWRQLAGTADVEKLLEGAFRCDVANIANADGRWRREGVGGAL